MPQPYPTLSQLTTPPRRQMSPEEISALWAQGQQGMQPAYPVSLADLATEGIGSFLDEADVSKYLLPAALLGLVRYKKPGVSAAAREAAEQYHRMPVSDPIQARDTVFHATDPQFIEPILKHGAIVPWLKSEDMGVSVSRVPRISSKGTKAVSFVIDPEKMPPSRPFTEPGYKKTFGDQAASWQVDEYGKSRMNPQFEFEDRTFERPIPTSAVREIWLDVPAYFQRFLPGTDREVKLQTLRELVSQHGLPLREFSSGREMHSGRARTKKK